MQKRARAVETQKLRRTFKARSRVSDHDGMSSGLAYLRLCLLWFTMISLDVLVGFRVELLWPFILILRAAYDSMARSTSSFVALGNQNSAQISILFVCVTATSDLICWLFIPVRFLIFLASTYVWLNLVWHTNGGFIRTVSTILSDRSQGIPIVLLWIVFIAVEIFVRLRCDYLVFAKDSPLAAVLNTPSSQFGCENVRGLSPGLARMLNEFFGAHCIGYPLVIVSFSLRYYFREWRLRRKQGDVSKQNEVLYKVLTEALPAVYEGPKQYQARLEQDTIEYELTSDVPMLMPAAPSSNGLANGTSLAPAAPASRKPSLRQSQTSQAPANRRERKRAAKLADNAQRTPPERTRQQENQDGQASRGTAGAATAGGSSCWEENGPARGLWSAAWSTLQWVATKLSEPVNDAEDASSYNDEDDDDDDSSLGDDVESNKKRNGRVAAESKQRNVQSQSSSGSGKKKPQSKVVAVQRQQAEERMRANGSSSSAGGCAPISTTSGSVLEVAPMPQMSNGHAKREDSVDKRQRAESKDKGVQENNNHAQGCEVELSRVRTEIHAAKALEADLRLQLSVAQNGESRAKQEVTQLRSRLEQLQARFGTVEKTREQEKSQTGQLERKYAELMNRKNDVERELLAERRMRAEDAAKKHKTSAETSNEQRERELRLEAEGERLRTECAAKEDALLVMQQELYQLRDYREKHDVDALQMELSILREKNAHLDATLASENKLKQDLFRALGEAKENNKELSAQLDQLRASAPSPAPPVPTPSRPSPPLHEKTHSTLPMPPPSYETCLPNNFMPYSFVSSPAPSPTGEHTLFEAHPLSGCGSRGAGPVDFALTLGHFDKFMASNAPGKPGSTRTS